MTRATMTRRVLIGLTALLAVVVVAGAAVVLGLDPNAHKGRIEEAVRRATGRDLALAGPLHLRWSAAPTLEAHDIRLANLPGGSRPEMVRVERAELRVALLPLLSRRVEVLHLLLVRPDVVLESVDGRPNWLGPQPRPADPAAPADPAPTPGRGEAVRVLVREVRIEDGRIAWRASPAPESRTVRVSVPRFALDSPADDAPARIAADLVAEGAPGGTPGGVPVAVEGTTGPWVIPSPAQGSPASGGVAPWPVALRASGAGARLSAEGALGPGAAVRVEGGAEDLSLLGPALGLSLPPLRAVQAGARVAPDGVSDLSLRVGASDLGATVPGLRVEAFEARAPAPDRPVEVAGAGALGAAPLRLRGTLGPAPGGSQAGTGAAPIELVLEGAGTTASLRGTVPLSAAPGGLDVAVSARVPDLRAFEAPGRPLPPLRDAALDAHLSDPAGLARGVAVRGLRLVLPQGDVSGDVRVAYAPRPALRGALASGRLDVDALLAAWRAAQPAAAAASPAPPAPVGEPPARTRLIPDMPLPFEALRRADADLRLTAGEAVFGGVSYRAVEAHLALAEGRLRLEPFGMRAPGGRVDGRASADAGQPAPPVSLALRAPGLALGPLLAAFGAPEGASGDLDLDLDLRGAGTTTRAVAATLSGHLGAALVDGVVDAALLDRVLGGVLRGAGVPVDLGGRNRLRCLALRAEAADGVVEVRTLLLDTTRLRLEGDGRVGLADESLAFHLRPLLRLGGTGAALALRVGGTMLAPKLELDKTGGDRFRLLLGGLAPQPAEAQECGPQLAAARGGRPGPAPAPPEAPPPPRPADLLRGLLR